MRLSRLKLKKCIIAGLIIVLALWTAGCGESRQSKEEESDTLNQEIGVNAGEVKVYMDEARYYLYTAQATYEVYYISKGDELDWNSEMKAGVTWQQGVKSMVLDDICRRECMYAMAEDYNVSLSDDELEQTEEDVKNFFENSDETLISNVNISEKRLKYVFEKKLIAEKVEEIMTVKDKNLPDETYEKWKKGNTVTAEEKWESISFEEPIFTLEDIQ